MPRVFPCREIAEQKMSVAGIDISSKAVDIVILDDDSDHGTWHRYSIADPRGPFFAARNVRPFVPGRDWLEDNNVWLIGIEDPMSRYPHVAKALGMVAGALAVRFPQDITILQMQPAEWKREFCGDAKADKVAVKLEVLRRMSPKAPVWEQDGYDAYSIAWAARAINQRAVEAA